MRSADDRSTPAVIRDEALRLYADRGPDAVTVRDIAAAAGVSPGLVIHHFGSKAALRRAVDDHVVATIERIFDDAEAGAPEEVAGGWLAEAVVSRLPEQAAVVGYLRRLLLSGDPAGMRLFAQWFEIRRRGAADPVGGGAAPGGDPLLRAAFLLVNDLGRLLLRDQLSVVLGADPLGRSGLRRWTGEAERVFRGARPAAAPADGGWTAPER